MKQLQDKVAIVTGAGRGIGKAIAIGYAAEGAKVVVASRTAATVNSVTTQIRDAGGTALGLTCDVGHKDQIFSMVDRTIAEFGKVDILVNNAQGFGTEEKPQPSTLNVAMQDTSDEELMYTFRTGAMATFWAMTAVFPHMKDRGGKIINFGSTSGMLGIPGNTSYNIAKEAIRALTRTAANEWGQYNIIVNTFNPTLRTDAFTAWETARPELIASMIDKTPLKRLGDPVQDGVPLAVFLASDGNSYMTGMTFHLGGGRVMP